MNLQLPKYRCRACGSTSYQRLTHRGPDGVMQYSGIHRCSGCSLRFSQLDAWRERRATPRTGGPNASGGSSDSIEGIEGSALEASAAFDAPRDRPGEGGGPAHGAYSLR